MKQLENQPQNNNVQDGENPDAEKDSTSPGKRSFLPVFLFLLVIGLLAAGGYFGWQEFMKYRQANLNRIAELQAQIDRRATLTQLEDRVAPLQQSVGRSDSRLAKLEQGQQSLLQSTEKLYELYGRDENGWKLAEVDYLMSIAQHKLVLENDFEGAAKTLEASSQLIARLADPGLLPVRVQINEEIARLKTRARPDLVGMTLNLARLARQIISLKPGYQTKTVSDVIAKPNAEDGKTTDPDQPLEQRVMHFLTSLVTISNSGPEAKDETQAVVVDVTQMLEDNLKLTRWSVLERDAFQYKKLMAENVDLFKRYYDLENAANADFYDALLQLQKSGIKPELPDISGSLALLREIIKKRENSPQPVQQEAENG